MTKVLRELVEGGPGGKGPGGSKRPNLPDLFPKIPGEM